MLGATLVILTLIAAAWYVAKVGTVFTLAVHRRRGLHGLQAPAAHRLHGGVHAAAHRLHLRAAGLRRVEGIPVADAGGAVAAQHPPAAQGADLASLPQGLHAVAAVDVADREGSARSRHGVVGRRAVHRQTQVRKAASQQAPAAHRRGTGLHRRSVRRAVPHVRRLGHHAPARRHAAEGLGLPQVEGLLRDDHPEEIRRPGVLRVRATPACW